MDNDNATATALMQRDAVIMLLIAQAQGLIQRLALLSNFEKAAVIGLMAVGQAMVTYARAAQPDPEVMAGFDRVLAALSPALAGRIAGSCPVQACLKESGAYAGALAACLRSGQGRERCERAALNEAAAEAACMTRNLRELLAVLAPPANPSQRKPGVTHPLPSQG